MSEIRKLPAQAERVETGPVQFGDDWPGVFIRGDNAFAYAMTLEAVCRGEGGSFGIAILDGLRRLLQGAVVGPARDLVPADAPLDRWRGPLSPLPVPAPAPTLPLQHDAPRCAACGIKFDGPMGYVCPHPRCPTGLGGPTCCAQDPIIGN